MESERRKFGMVLALTFAVLFATLTLSVSIGCASGTPPEEEWRRTFGGTGDDAAWAVQQTTDGGYILAGWTASYRVGGADFWLVKTDANGSKQWSRTFGDGAEIATSAQQTTDGGYILTGWTNSYGVGFDFWLVKTDANGSKQWSKTFDGTGADAAWAVQQTTDGGYIIAGSTQQEDRPLSVHDFWLVKTDANGSKQWSKTFGGTEFEIATSAQQTADGGYILAGYTNSYGVGRADFWLVKTDANGSKRWNKTFGGTGYDSAFAVQQTADGGYILAGETDSYGAGGDDFWLVKTDANGSKQWSKTFGGTGDDAAWAVQQTTDGGYILAGWTESYGAGGDDFWLVKTDANGSKQWSKTFGGTGDDAAWAVQQTADGGYILAGETDSYGVGGYDFWLIKVRTEQGEQ